MNVSKIICVLLIACICIQSQVFSFNRNDSTYLKKLYEKGEKAYLKKDYSRAKEKLTKFISIPCPVSDTIEWSDPGYFYIRLKHQACEYLKQIYYNENNFKIALEFNELQRRKYYTTSPGDIWTVTEKWFALDNFASMCYEGLGNFDKAISCIMRHWGFYGTQERFVNLAIKKVGLDSLKSELIESLDNITIKDSSFVIKLLGFEIFISYFSAVYVKSDNHIFYLTEEQIEQEKKRVRENFKQSEFYKSIMKE